MGLKTDIENAFVEALGVDVDDKGNYPELAQNLTDAIIKFIQAQKFTITQMKSILEVESITTTGDIPADIKSNVKVNRGILTTNGGPTTSDGIISNKSEGVRIPKLNLKQSRGQGSSMTAVGHAYIGNNPVDPSERNDTEEDNVVQLVNIDQVSKK